MLGPNKKKAEQIENKKRNNSSWNHKTGEDIGQTFVSKIKKHSVHKGSRVYVSRNVNGVNSHWIHGQENPHCNRSIAGDSVRISLTVKNSRETQSWQAPTLL